MREIEVIFDTDEIQDYLLEKLVSRGFIPRDDELAVLADIVFDYLLHKEVIEEEK